MPRLVRYILIVSTVVLWYFILFGESEIGVNSKSSSGSDSSQSVSAAKAHEGSASWLSGGIGGVAASSSDSRFEGRDFHLYGSHIRRNLNHCWRRYDGYNLQNTVFNKKEQLKKPYGILCNFKCTWFFTVTYPTCEFIYDYKLSCHLFTSLPDCTAVKCTLLNYFT